MYFVCFFCFVFVFFFLREIVLINKIIQELETSNKTIFHIVFSNLNKKSCWEKKIHNIQKMVIFGHAYYLRKHIPVKGQM